jgi:hypothetical protein
MYTKKHLLLRLTICGLLFRQTSQKVYRSISADTPAILARFTHFTSRLLNLSAKLPFEASFAIYRQFVDRTGRIISDTFQSYLLRVSFQLEQVWCDGSHALCSAKPPLTTRGWCFSRCIC